MMTYKQINKLLINLPKGFKIVLRSSEWVASLCGRGIEIMECDLQEFCGESPNEAIELMVKEIAGKTIIWNGTSGTAIYEVPVIFPKIEMTDEMEAKNHKDDTCDFCIHQDVKAVWKIETLSDEGFQNWNVCDKCLERLNKDSSYLSVQSSKTKKIEYVNEMEDIIYAEGRREFTEAKCLLCSGSGKPNGPYVADFCDRCHGNGEGQKHQALIRVPCKLALDDGSGLCGGHTPRALLRPVWAQASFETPGQVIDLICGWLIEGHPIPNEVEVSYIPL